MRECEEEEQFLLENCYIEASETHTSITPRFEEGVGMQSTVEFVAGGHYFEDSASHQSVTPRAEEEVEATGNTVEVIASAPPENYKQDIKCIPARFAGLVIGRGGATVKAVSDPSHPTS